MNIVVLTNGWVFKGDFNSQTNTLTNGSVVRRWNTTKGIGELVLNPLINPLLDPLPPSINLTAANILFWF